LWTYLKRGLSRKLPEDQILGQGRYSDINTNLNNLKPFIYRHWRKGVLGTLLIIFTSLLSFPQPLITRYLIDNVIMGHKPGLLAGVVLLLAAFSLASKLSSLLQEFYFARFEQEILLEIREDLFNHVLRLPKAFFDAKETGYLMSRLSDDVDGLRWFFSSTMVRIAESTLRFIGGIVFLFYLQRRLALVVLVVLPGLFFIVGYFSKKLYALSHYSMEQHARVSSRLQESLSSVPLIKALSSEERTTGRIMSEMKKAFQLSLEQTTVSSVANLVITSTPGVAKVMVLFAGAYWVIKGQWTLGSLLAFQAYLANVFGPAEFLATANLQLQNARAALERVSALYDIVPEENAGTGQKVEELRGEIEFRNVTFYYDDREPMIKDLSFHIRAGEHAVILGPSGAGKTTLLSLILGFYKPVSGEIYFDGRPASEYEISSLRRRVGYVSQNTQLLTGTIIENLRYGKPGATEEQVRRAIKAAGIDDFVNSLPEGYNTHLGGSRGNLSEGQKQRLSIARALVQDPDILVFDEPTSAIDSIAENAFFAALPSLLKNKTVLVVSHHVSNVKQFDQIISIDPF